MRVIKGIVLFCFSMVAVSGCFEAPEFSDTPRISFKDIKFKEVGEASDWDSLILYLDFKDGNGDLGLSATYTPDFDYPYNSEYYFLAHGTKDDGSGEGDTIPIIATVRGENIILNEDELPGKIVTTKTRTVPTYGYLPPYDPTSCVDYSPFSGILVPFSSIDDTYNVVGTVEVNGRTYAKIQETLLFRANPNHYNIEVKFWLFNGATGEYDREFDWFAEYCFTYDGRFNTSLSEVPSYPERPIEGTLRYAMANSSFLGIFGNSQMQISARIRDRALNTSNTVYTEVFDLERIRQ